MLLTTTNRILHLLDITGHLLNVHEQFFFKSIKSKLKPPSGINESVLDPNKFSLLKNKQ